MDPPDDPNMSDAAPPVRTGARMTRYEVVKVLASRVEQLVTGAPPVVPREPGDCPLDTALRELEARKLPFVLQRTLPNGAVESIRLADLELPRRTMQHISALRMLPNEI